LLSCFELKGKDGQYHSEYAYKLSDCCGCHAISSQFGIRVLYHISGEIARGVGGFSEINSAFSWGLTK
jgi:hypothetical protein